jgi:hypothetical protein
MSHSLIFGMTESGKTTFATQLARAHKASGFGVIVLDPMLDPRWRCDFLTASADEFLRVFWGSQRCMAFIDEAGESVGRYDELMVRTATKGRHWGHSCHYLSQRGALLNRTVRDQCSHLFLFATSSEDCKLHAAEWNKPQLREGSSLLQGEYFHATRFGVLESGSIFTKE